MELRKAEDEIKSLILVFNPCIPTWIQYHDQTYPYTNSSPASSVPYPTKLKYNDVHSHSITISTTSTSEGGIRNDDNHENHNNSDDLKETMIASDSFDSSSTIIDNQEDEIILPPEEFWSLLQSIKLRLEVQASVMKKFDDRMNMKDPVTNASRYGAKTLIRVQNLLNAYNQLSQYMNIAFYGTNHNPNPMDSTLDSSSASSSPFTTNTIASTLQNILHKKDIQRQYENKIKEEKSRQELQKQLQIELEMKRQQEYELELQKQKKIQEIEKKLNQIQEEEQRIQEQKRLDDEFVSSIMKGIDGVQLQLQRLKENLIGPSSNNNNNNSNVDHVQEYKVAIQALHTLFQQIIKHPEEIKFRKIKRDHARFLQDIGRHVGGKELLIASGFTLEVVEDVPCFFSKEPDLETNMDEWSDWFSLLKSTFSLLEEEVRRVGK